MAISPRNRGQLKRIVDRWTLPPILAALQILNECRSRMRGSVHGRILMETALVRAALLEELTSLQLARGAARGDRVGAHHLHAERNRIAAR